MAKNQVVLTSRSEQGIDRDIVAHLRSTFGAKDTAVSQKADVVESISLPREKFLKALKSDSTLRAIVRTSETEVQEVFVKPLGLGEKMDAPVFVQHAKTVAISKRDGTSIPLGNSIGRVREFLEEWGQVKIPAIILLMLAGGTLYGAWRLSRVANDLAEDYANQISAAAESEAGLERAIQARSGRRQQQVATTSAPATTQSEEPERLTEKSPP